MKFRRRVSSSALLLLTKLSLSNVIFLFSLSLPWFRMENLMPIYRRSLPPFTSSPASSFSKYTPLHHRLHHMSLLIIMTYYIIAYIIHHYLHYNDILHHYLYYNDILHHYLHHNDILYHYLYHNDILYHYLHHNDVIFISRVPDF